MSEETTVTADGPRVAMPVPRHASASASAMLCRLHAARRIGVVQRMQTQCSLPAHFGVVAARTGEY